MGHFHIYQKLIQITTETKMSGAIKITKNQKYLDTELIISRCVNPAGTWTNNL